MRSIVALAPTITTPVGVTGGYSRHPVCDRFGRQLELGDVIESLVCVGRYGQVKTVVAVVDQVHLPLGLLSADSGETINFHIEEPHDAPASGRRLIGLHEHHDYEHGHLTWTRILMRNGERMLDPVPAAQVARVAELANDAGSEAEFESSTEQSERQRG